MLKNENRYILHEDGRKPKYTMLEQNLRRLRSLVEEVYIVDNASDDGSKEVYDRYKESLIKYVLYNTDDMPFDDVRDRQALLQKAHQRGMKWALIVDGDEIYEDRATDWIHTYCRDHSPHGHHVVKFHYVNFWRGRTRYRTDMWHASWFPRLFSMTDLVLRGTALHNYSFQYASLAGIRLPENVVEAPVKCLHYGWADWDHRVAKTKRYIERDMQLNHISYEFAKTKYANDVNEYGLQLAPGDPNWASEMRGEEIDY